MKKQYIYEAKNNKDIKNDKAIIMLPDIYCQTEYSKHTAEEFSSAFDMQVFILDYFYLGTNKANNFNENDREEVHALMENFKGGEFVDFCKKVMLEIKELYPNIKKFIIIGFCFGGRLAYIAGGEDSVFKVISFYGGGANTPNYVEGITAVEYIANKKKGRTLSVDSFFGINDPSIPEEDRIKIKETMSEGGINYVSHEYNAGHAYFQEGRKNYDAYASQQSWEVLKKMLY